MEVATTFLVMEVAITFLVMEVATLMAQEESQRAAVLAIVTVMGFL